jgi:two-component system response regulator GlrR
MLSYDWPGNVRELENVIERAVVFSARQIVQDSDIVLPRLAENALLMESFREAKHRFVRTYIEKLLISHKGNISQAARAADKDRRAFFELMRKYRIEAKSFRSDCS